MITNYQIEEALLKSNGSVRGAATILGISRSTLRSKLASRKVEILEIPQAPDGDLSAEEIIENKKKLFTKKKELQDFNELINIKVNDTKPIAVCLIGDPHIDDDGCDIIKLESDLNIIRNTEGMYAGHLGDLTNNWVGRLARLYAHQTTTAAQGIKLTEWMLNRCPNLFVVGGNHDCWNQGMDVISFILRQHKAVFNAHGLRISLNFPNGKKVRINARHDFKGHSQYNPTHGHRKEQLWSGNKDHIYVSGHRHIDAASVIPQSDGTCSWSLIVSGYKAIDDYADAHGFTSQHMNPSVTVIINPQAKTEAELVKPYWDTQAAADYLTFLRSK